MMFRGLIFHEKIPTGWVKPDLLETREKVPMLASGLSNPTGWVKPDLLETDEGKTIRTASG